MKNKSMKTMDKAKFKQTYDVLNCIQDPSNSKFDPLGSYTGASTMNERPTQDADDL